MLFIGSPPESLYDAFDVIRFGGIITYFGLHFGGKNVINLDVNDMIFRKISLIPTFAEPAMNFPVATRLWQDGLVDAKALPGRLFFLQELAGPLVAECN